ncbi:MAG: hypothetical protein CSB03_00640 [Bacteroidia bacterium]|nr:MAG: hypothetical protein CSB03_00640 [Bacteroidia bacterium]
MQKIINILRNRNTILVMSIVLGLTVGDIAHSIKHLTFYILAFVLSFSTTGIATSEFSAKKDMFTYPLYGFLLNYVLFSAVLLPVAYFLSPSKEIFYGFVIIAATPPGVAVIPFSYMLGGNLKKSILGTLGGFLASILVTPLMIKLFTGEESMSFFELFMNMIKIILIPLLLSRVLLTKPLKNFTTKVRGNVVNWGFAVIIFTAVGINRGVLLSDYVLVLDVALIFFIGIFVLGQAFDIISRKMGMKSDDSMSFNLLLTIKSSGFSVVTAIAIFNNSAVVPSAVMSIFVLLYLLFLTFQKSYRERK